MKLMGMIFLYSYINQDEAVALEPLQEPDAVTFTFETIGWPILGFLILILIYFMLYKWLKHYKHNAYRRDAIKEILMLENQFQKEQNSIQLNKTLVLLKLVAITTFGRKQVAHLYGNDWLKYLDSKANNISFIKYNETIFNALNESKKNDLKNSETVFKLTKKWIKTHA